MLSIKQCAYISESDKTPRINYPQLADICNVSETTARAWVKDYETIYKEKFPMSVQAAERLANAHGKVPNSRVIVKLITEQ